MDPPQRVEAAAHRERVAVPFAHRQHRRQLVERRPVLAAPGAREAAGPAHLRLERRQRAAIDDGPEPRRRGERIVEASLPAAPDDVHDRHVRLAQRVADLVGHRRRLAQAGVALRLALGPGAQQEQAHHGVDRALEPRHLVAGQRQRGAKGFLGDAAAAAVDVHRAGVQQRRPLERAIAGALRLLPQPFEVGRGARGVAEHEARRATALERRRQLGQGGVAEPIRDADRAIVKTQRDLVRAVGGRPRAGAQQAIERLRPVLRGLVVVGQHAPALVEAIGVQVGDGGGDRPVQRLAPLAEQRRVRDVVRERVIEHVRHLGVGLGAVHQLQLLELGQRGTQAGPEVGDALQQAGGELAADDRCEL